MPTKSPKTPFSTRLSGNARETELRLRSMFQWQKKRPSVWLFSFMAFVIFGCMGLVSCERRQVVNDVLLLNTSAGQEIMVELDLEPTERDEKYYAVTQLRVMEDGHLLQVIDSDELTRTQGIEGLYLLRGYDIGEPDIRDFNFDGSEDFSLLVESTLPQNPAHLFFLWNEKEQQFKDAFIMTGLPEVDAQQKQLVERMTDYQRSYYVYQDGVLCQNPATAETMKLLEQIGKPIDQFSGMEYQSVAIPDASGECLVDAETGVRYFFFGTQGLPGLTYLSEEYRNQLRCAGVVSTVGEIYPEIIEDMPLPAFCSVLGISEYAYGFEPRPDQGWLQFPWEGYTVWIDTGSRDLEVYDPGNIGIDTDDLILIEDEQIVNENMVIQYKQWSDMLNAELRG